MTEWKRRRLLQAALAAGSAPLLKWGGARAQSPDRNLFAAERPAAPGAAGGVPLLIAPRHALVIGNSAYGFGPLKNPANDARALAEELKRTGFEVVTGLDLPRKEMLEAIRAYAEAIARAKAVGLFYFAGHGVQLAWRNYLLPTDAVIGRIEDIQARCVDVNAVIEGIGKAANPMNVIILDACRENPFARGGKVEQKGLSQLDAPPGTLLAYATSPGNVASDGDGANGLYTEQLLREIMVPEAKIEDVFKRVRLAVRRRSNGQQIPWESTSLEEDFWFVPPKELQRLAQEEAERVRREQEAERVLKEKLERARRETLERARQEELERVRREQETERARQEELQRLRREQLERARREEFQRAYQEEMQRRRREELERAYKEESELWQRVSVATEPGPLEDYLRRYPSGHFAEIAQAQLDRVLARQGEKKIEIAQQTQNPYTQGSASTDTDYKIGDSYTYNQMDLYSKVVSETFTITVTRITDTQVIYNDGRVITDLLGNPVKARDGREFSPHQSTPSECSVGKRWSTRFSVRHPQFGDFASSLDIRIVAKEKVTVPAGTFECFRIEARGQSIGRTGMLAIHNKVWLCPGRLRRAVAADTLRMFMGRPTAAERIELVSFKQS